MAGVKYPQPDGLVIDKSRKQKWQSEHGYLATDSRHCDRAAIVELYLEERPKSTLGWIQEKTLQEPPVAMPIYPTCNTWIKKALAERGEELPLARGQSGKPPTPPKNQAVDEIDSQFEEWWIQECEAKKPAAYDAWLSEHEEAILQRALDKARAELAAKRAKMAPQQPQEPQEPAETPLSGELLEPEGKGVSVSVAVDGAKGSKGAGIVGAIVDVPRK